MKPCAYCGHESAKHAEGACREASRALPAGFRPCHCTTYRAPEEGP